MMKPLIDSPPRTMMEVYKSLPEGTLAELIENQLIMSPSPLAIHQKVLQRIYRKFAEQIEDLERGEIFVAPIDVYLDEERNAVQPDIVIVLSKNKSIVNLKGHIHGVPDMIVEILSLGNKDHDRVKKKALYERFGVKEYWMVDPETKATEGYTLKAGTYTPLTSEVGKFSSPLLGIEIGF
ncbi:MAG: Uma2 family endonuclease [Cyclobacteriaceae bacterium]|nr:Uma2 family endonuclease [Cyclobacteriaceae bacterium]